MLGTSVQEMISSIRDKIRQLQPIRERGSAGQRALVARSMLYFLKVISKYRICDETYVFHFDWRSVDEKYNYVLLIAVNSIKVSKFG